MQEKEKTWVKSKIAEYYSKANISIIEIRKREFGTGNWDKKIEQRHLSFGTEDELKGYLIQERPLYVSYSTAMYKYPDARPMENKQWLGSELTFDLDGESTNIEDINKIKQDLLELISVLKRDFGMKKYSANFSGSRGFHLHVYDEDYLQLSSEGRRKIIDYLKASGFDYMQLFNDENQNKILYGPKLSDFGIRKRFAENIKNLKKEELFGRARITSEMIEKAVTSGNYGTLPIKKNEDIIKKLKPASDMLSLKSINVDAGVTYDTSKLIRAPETLHGATGMVAVEIPEREIEKFNPFESALPFSKDEFEEVVYSKSFNALHGGEKILKRKGMREKVPKSMALFFVLKEYAVLP